MLREFTSKLKPEVAGAESVLGGLQEPENKHVKEANDIADQVGMYFNKISSGQLHH